MYLDSLNFPLFEERFRLLQDPLPGLVTFRERVKAVDGIVMVSP